jgi:hypothetical protein
MTSRAFKKGDRVEWRASENTRERGVVVGHVDRNVVMVLWDSGERMGAPTVGPRRIHHVKDTRPMFDDATVPDHLSETLEPDPRRRRR